jgi:hypothetical protein
MSVISGGTVIQGALYRMGGSLSGQEGVIGGGGTLAYPAYYSFAVEGGAVSTIGLTGLTGIPSGSVVVGGYINVITPPVGAGASIAVQVNAAADLQAAAAISGAPWSTAGMKNIVPRLNDASTWITLTAARDVSAVISAAPLTAGAFNVILWYLSP